MSESTEVPDYGARDSIALARIESPIEWAYAVLNKGLAQFAVTPDFLGETMARLELMDTRSLQRVRDALDGRVAEDLTEDEAALRLDFYPFVFPHPNLVQYFEDLRVKRGGRK